MSNGIYTGVHDCMPDMNTVHVRYGVHKPLWTHFQPDDIRYEIEY